jgi:hypothetical protein
MAARLAAVHGPLSGLDGWRKPLRRHRLRGAGRMRRGQRMAANLTSIPLPRRSLLRVRRLTSFHRTDMRALGVGPGLVWACAAALAAAGALACRSVTGPPLPAGARPFTPPPAYARWWAQTEACAGRRGDLAAVRWYTTPGARTITQGRDTGLAGYYSPPSHRIVLADTAALGAAEVRHEMLHALLGEPGHPRAAFVENCGGTVSCVGPCVTDAGPAPAPDPATAAVAPGDVSVRAAVEPAAPDADDRRFSYTLVVTNRRPTPVTVVLPSTGGYGPAVRWGWTWDRRCAEGEGPPERPDATCGSEQWNDPYGELAAATRFRAGEAKRFVVDFRVDARAGKDRVIAPGTYVLRASYGGVAADGTGNVTAPDTVALRP